MNSLDLAETLGHEAALLLFYMTILADLPFKNGLGAEYGFSFGSINDLPHTTRNLAVHLARRAIVATREASQPRAGWWARSVGSSRDQLASSMPLAGRSRDPPCETRGRFGYVSHLPRQATPVVPVPSARWNRAHYHYTRPRPHRYFHFRLLARHFLCGWVGRGVNHP